MDGDDEFWEESDSEQDIAWEVDTECGLEANPWLCHLPKDGTAELNIRRQYLPEAPHVAKKADAWGIMVELVKHGAQLDTEIESYFGSLFSALVRVATDDPYINHSYCLLNFLLQRLGNTLTSHYLTQMIAHCLSAAGRGKKAVSRLLEKHGASVPVPGRRDKAGLQNEFLRCDDVWLAALCQQKNWLSSPAEELSMPYDCRRNSKVARYFLQQLNESTLKTIEHRGCSTTPLHIAVCRHDVGLARALIRRGANVHVMNNDNLSPLQLTVQGFSLAPNIKLARLLLDNGADPFSGEYLPEMEPNQCICQAKLCDPIPTIWSCTLALKEMFNRSAFSMAISMGTPEMVKCLLQGYQLSSQHPCTICGYLRLSVCFRMFSKPRGGTTSLLLKEGANPNGCGMCAEPPVTFYVKALRAILLQGYPKRNRGPLFLLTSIYDIITAGADVNKTDADGETAVSIMKEVLSYKSERLSNGEVNIAQENFLCEIRELFGLVYDDLGNGRICLLKDWIDPDLESVG